MLQQTISSLRARRGQTGGRKKLALTLGAALVVAGGLVPAGAKPSPNGRKVEEITVEASPIAAFDRANPDRTRFGKLTWRGGLVLRSPSRYFGGWSGLALDADGKRLVAVSDDGTWMTADLVYEGKKPLGLSSARLGPLQSRAGRTLTTKHDRDAESVSLVKGTLDKGDLLISFERKHRVGRFDIGKEGVSAPKSYIDLPKAAKRMQANRGLEAVTVLRGGPYKGSLVAIPERLHTRSGNPIGWLWVNGRPQQFQFSNSGDYDVTDVKSLPDGSLLVLERRFRSDEGVKARLRLVRRHELRPAARIKGEILLDADMNQEIDNMEGLAVHEGAGGAIVVTMISDDNFNRWLQRTILLQFSLEGIDLASADDGP